jgi:peptidyl-prolyl cis-trans isomerase SurA
MKPVTAILAAFVFGSSALLAGQTAPQAAQTPVPAPAPSPQGVIIEQILVKVNGELFTKTDLEQRQIDALRASNRQVNSPGDLNNDATLKAALVEITPGLLVEAIDDLLMIQRGKELGLTPSAAQLKDTADRIKKQNNITSDEQFRSALQQSGMTYEEFEKNLEKEYIKARVSQQEIMTKIQLTEEESRDYYRTHPTEFEKPATVSIRDIFISVPTTVQGGQTVVNVAADDEVAKKIADIRARAIKGEDFAKLVAEVSESPSKSNGGLIGPINVSELAPQVHDLLDKMKPGDISEPIHTPTGYQLIKLETRTAPTPEPFETVREDIANRIGTSRLEAEQKKYIDKLRAQAIIEWKNEQLHQLYDQKMAAGKDTRRP